MQDVQFVLTYDSIRKFDDRLRRIEAAVIKDAANEAELVALRAEVVTLMAAAKTSEEEKAAMDARIKAAKERTQSLEDKERAALPPST